MKRKNFYLLLDLSLNPPESDPGVIEEAIKKKQAEWSRYRNHPTRALEAKHNIDLIPEIRKVMLTTASRLQEARDALALLEKKERKLFSDVDRHINMCLTKGYVTDEEIARLSKLHKMEAERLRRRVREVEKSRWHKLDEEITQRTKKGFITTMDIEVLAERHAVKVDDIRARVTCPINDDGLKALQHTKQLDPTIEKTINENLRIIGKTSLYDFLNLPENSDLKTLQKKAQEKKSEIQKTMKKDAVVTASLALIGHCIALFKSDEARQLYDMTRARSYLTLLNSDIDVAAMNGIIRMEYLDALINRAMDFGMTREEALEYVKSYCRKKKWKIESPGKKSKKSSRLKRYAAVVAIALVVMLIPGIYYAQKVYRLKLEYAAMLDKVDHQSDPVAKQKILQQYVRSHAPDAYTSKAGDKIRELQRSIDEKMFENSLQSAHAALSREDYETALAVYDRLLERFSAAPYVRKIEQEKDRVSRILEDRAYERLLNQVVAAETPDVKLAAFQKFMTDYPQSRYLKAIRELIQDMRNEYYLFIRKKIALSEKAEDWEQCASYCDQFLKLYPKDSRAQALNELRLAFNERLRYQKIIGNLKQRADLAGNDLNAARQVYADYVAAYPDSMITPQVRQEIARLDDRIQVKKMSAYKDALRNDFKNSAGRFVEIKENVISDQNTGLMWCLLDSADTGGGCLAYEDAVQYVKGLQTGAYGDWRLPTLKELESFYMRQPAFPRPRNGQAAWYWTSKSYVLYDGGWSKLIDVLMLTDGQWERGRKKTWECGAVRAVRP